LSYIATFVEPKTDAILIVDEGLFPIRKSRTTPTRARVAVPHWPRLTRLFLYRRSGEMPTLVRSGLNYLTHQRFVSDFNGAVKSQTGQLSPNSISVTSSGQV
jgi:hypothetical protein